MWDNMYLWMKLIINQIDKSFITVQTVAVADVLICCSTKSYQEHKIYL